MTFANGLCSTHSSRTAFGQGLSGPVATVELLDENGEDPPALRRIDDDSGRSGKVSDDVVFEVEGELGMGGQVGQPVAPRGCRDSAQGDVITSNR